MSISLLRNTERLHNTGWSFKASRLIGYRKRESFHPDGPMWRTPVTGAAPRVGQGLDMDKIVTYPYIPFWKTREKYASGYKFPERNLQPHINTLTPEEMVTYYDTDNFLSKYSTTELFRAWCRRYARGYIYFMTFPAIAGMCCLVYFVLSNRFEAIEYYMPVEEYYENYVWHDLGKFIDKKAYDQYLEARRAKKWGRAPHIDPVDYIPLKYRSEKQLFDNAELDETEES